MQNAGQIIVAGTGRIMDAAVGTVAPAGAEDEFGVGWADLGLTSEDGVTFNVGKETEGVPVWQALYDARRFVTGRSARLEWVLRQWNRQNLVAAWGGEVVEVEPVTVPPSYRFEPATGGEDDERALCIEWLDGDKVYRLFVPRYSVADDVETNLTRTGPADLPLAVEALGSPGVLPWYIVSNDPAMAPAA